MLSSRIDEQTTVHHRIYQVLSAPQFIAIPCLLTLLSNFFGWELLLYTFVALTVVYLCVWGKDLLPMIPLVILCYISPSRANNPGRNEQSVFSIGHGGAYLLFLAGVMVLALVYYVIRNRKNFFTCKRSLLVGILLLAGAYLLSGVGSEGYTQRAGSNLPFALLQSLAIVLPYLIFAGGVKWEDARKDYFAWVGFGVGCVLFCQIIYIYLTQNVIVDGIIDRSRIYTGWGIHNNLGGMQAMMIPFAFCLASKYNRGWLGTVVGSGFLVGVCLTCSRNSILIGIFIYLVCVSLMFYYARNRKGNTIALISFLSVTAFLFIIFNSQLYRLFSEMIEKGLDLNYRDVTYVEGMKLFTQAPIFGVSFFSPGFQPWDWSTVSGFSSFFPPRWHNTIIQILVSCGAVGMIAYLVHRMQTVRLFFRRPHKQAVFIGCSILVLLITSLFDCHFFNIGPALFYSMALAFAEKYHET